MSYAWLDDDELERKVAELRDRAHDANTQSCFARARDWQVAHDELQRRKKQAA